MNTASGVVFTWLLGIIFVVGGLVFLFFLGLLVSNVGTCERRC